MFVVKAEHRGITRKFTYGSFPNWDDLYTQLYRVLRLDAYYIHLISISSPQGRLPIGQDVRSGVEYHRLVSPYTMTHALNGTLRLRVIDDKPRKEPYDRAAPAARETSPMDVDSTQYYSAPQPPPSWYSASGSEASTAPSTVQEDVSSMLSSFVKELNTTLAKHGLSESLVVMPVQSPLGDDQSSSAANTGLTPSLFNGFMAPTRSTVQGYALEGSGQQRPGPSVRFGNANMSVPAGSGTLPDPPRKPLGGLHPDVWCDMCHEPVRGIRHKCTNCVNYDLCNNCVVNKQGKQYHSQGAYHNFRAIETPIEESAEQATPVIAPKAVHSASCDVCGDVISGVRHKCKACPDYDMCSPCFKTYRGAHRLEHDFQSIPYPIAQPLLPVNLSKMLGATLPSPVHVAPKPASTPKPSPAPVVPEEETNPWSANPGTEHHAYCNACLKTIYGIRYVCVGCEDFDYCQSCVVTKRTEHDSSHQFWPVTHAGPLPIHVRDARRMRVGAQPPVTSPSTTPEAVAPEPSPSFAETIVLCDGCDKSLRGLERYKCLDCAYESFDLCSECYVSENFTHSADHEFHKIAANTRVVVHRVYDDGHEEVDEERTGNAASAAAAGSPVHDALCDVCNLVISGARWKCPDCNYDMCERCFSSEAKPAHHHLVRIAEPGEVLVHRVNEPATPVRPAPMSAETGTPVVHNAMCNLCDSRIEGVRFKCTRCPDFDLCEACFGITPEQHPHHAFAKVTKPEDVTNTPPVEQFHEVHPAICNSCKDHIVGVRFKCLHPSCPDFDLCQHCEALPIAVHPFNHPLVKFKHDFVTEAAGYDKIFDFVKTGGLRKATSPEATPTQPASTVRVPTLISETTRLTAAEQLEKDLFPPAPSQKVPSPTVPPSDMGPPFEFGAFANAATSATVTPLLATLSIEETPASNAAAPVAATMPEMIQREATPPVSVPALFRTASPTTTERNAVADIEENESVLKASFVTDNNIPDGHVFPPGVEFVKSWLVRNSGKVAWPETTTMMFVRGERMASGRSALAEYHVGRVEPGASVDVHAFDMKAPEEAGSYVSFWRLCDRATGTVFGDLMWCDVHVEAVTSGDNSMSSSSIIMMPMSAPVESPVPQASTPAEDPVSPLSAISSITYPGSRSGSQSPSSMSDASSSENGWGEIERPSRPERRTSGEFVFVDDEGSQSDLSEA